MRFDPGQSNSAEPLKKVVVQLGADAWHGFSEEVLWAKKMPDGTFEIRNTPFFAKGLAFLDVVRVSQKEGTLIVAGVAARSGRSTYRVFVENEAPTADVERLLQSLRSCGCTYESYVNPSWKLYAFDVLPSSVDAAHAILESGEKQGLWDFEQGHFGGRDG